MITIRLRYASNPYRTRRLILQRLGSPQKPGAKFDPLKYIASFFDTIEINSSFYRPFTASTAKSWTKRVADARDFKFTAKLHRVFTHERGRATEADEKAVREGTDALRVAGRLGALLIQFPWSFKNTDDDHLYLAKLLDPFKDYLLVVEVRHSSWNNAQIYEWLEELGVVICNEESYVITNNHFRGQAVVKALEIKGDLEGRARGCSSAVVSAVS